MTRSKRLALAPAAAAALLLLAAAPRPSQAQAAKAAAPRVAAMGDSLTDPRSGGGKYLTHLEKACGEGEFKSFGKGGEMVNQMRKRFLRDVYGEADEAKPAGEGRWSHVVVFGGVNDLYSDETAGRTVAKIEADLSKMYAWAKERGAKVVAITVAPWGGFKKYYTPRRGEATRALNDWIKAQKAAGRVDHVVDAYPLLSCGEPEKLCPALARPFKDGLHFGPEGHAALGEAIRAEVLPSCNAAGR